MVRVGVLALQGGYAAHLKALADLGYHGEEIRYAEQLGGLDGLILPGGESSTNILLLERYGLWQPLNDFAHSSKPVLLTCAGLILASSEVLNPAQRSFGWIDITVERNGWGRQVDSFEAVADDGKTPMMFIRAPKITRLGDDVNTLLTFKSEPVLVQQGNIVGATFHPELSQDRSIHTLVFGDSRLQVA